MAEIPVFWQPLSIPDVLTSAHQWRSMTWMNLERTDFSCAWQPCWSVDPTCIPTAGLTEEDHNKSWNSTHTELTSHLALHLTKTDLTLSFPARSIFKEPNIANKEPTELKTDSYGWVERKSATASPHNSFHRIPTPAKLLHHWDLPWAFQQGMRSDLPYHTHSVKVNRTSFCFPALRLWFKQISMLSLQEEGQQPRCAARAHC